MKFLFSFLLSFFVVLSYAQLPQELVENIQHRVDQSINPGIAIGIVDENGVRYYNFGVSKNGGNQVNEHSIFEIGSITKTFTAILLADMVLNGKVSLNDPVSKYLPESVTVPAKDDAVITLGHLSDHTSSLPRMPDNFTPADPLNPYADYSVEQMYAFLSGHQLRRPIGSEYEYSNYAQGLLGHVLSLKAGKSYEELMVDVIAKPLDMKETRIVFTPEMKKQLALPHSRGLEVSNWDIPTLAGAGAIRSSTSDMLKYVAANLGLTKTELSDAMQMTHEVRHDKGGRVGLGWHISNGAEGDVIWHNGGTGGYRAFAGFVKESKKGVVVLTNSDIGADDIGFYLLNSEAKLQYLKPSVAVELRKHIDQHGADGLEKRFNEIKQSSADDYDFDEMEINSLGYYYLGQKKTDAALVIFKINTEEYPESSNVWDSYGEALMEKGQTADAIINYKKSIELNPGNSNAVRMLEKMGVQVEQKEVNVNEDILQSYLGTYSLSPNFEIVITREGTQLFGQATGQGRFDMFPKNDTEFYLKVVDAQIHFNKNDAGEVVSLTLFQGGQVIEGKRQ